jgi:hypothetical protein
MKKSVYQYHHSRDGGAQELVRQKRQLIRLQPMFEELAGHRRAVLRRLPFVNDLELNSQMGLSAEKPGASLWEADFGSPGKDGDGHARLGAVTLALDMGAPAEGYCAGDRARGCRRARNCARTPPFQAGDRIDFADERKVFMNGGTNGRPRRNRP